MPALLLALEKPSALTAICCWPGPGRLVTPTAGQALCRCVNKEDGGGRGAQAELSGDSRERAASGHCLADGAVTLRAASSASLLIPGAAPGPSIVS